MKIYLNNLLLLFKRLFLILVFMTVTRIIFYIFNYNVFGVIKFPDIIMDFIYGLRFDIVAIVFANTLFILGSLLPSIIQNRNGFQKFLKYLFVIINSILLMLNIVDFKFFEFEGKRLTADYFSSTWLGHDFWALLPTFIKDYWYLFVIFIILVFLLIKLYPAFTKSQAKFITNRWDILKQILIAIVLIPVFIFLSRGGTQLRPIDIITASEYTAPQYVSLILNSPFTIMKTLEKNGLTVPQYYTGKQLNKIYSPIHKYKARHNAKRRNVVIIILESFGREYSGYLNNYKGFTPHFDSIMKAGLTFKNAYADGRRSLEALPSIFGSIPSLMDYPFISSPYTMDKIEGFPKLLKTLGYQTSFYHGGRNGTMGFEDFVKYAGVDKYYGLNEYPDKSDFDGRWGIFDEPYLSYFCDEISKMKQPFFTGVFTLSSHHPYTIPKKHKNQFPKGNLINEESIGYADFALGKFFKKAATKSWYKNTIFVLSADHTAQAYKPFYKTEVGRYAIPIVFFAPGDTTITGLSNTICEQSDIFPSIMQYLGYNKAFLSFGNSVFDTASPHFAISYAQKIYQFIYKNIAIHFDGNKIINIEKVSNNSITKLPVSDTLSSEAIEAKRLLKAVIQQFKTRILTNKMTINTEKP